MRHDILADVLSAIKNGNFIGAHSATTPSSKMVRDVLRILQTAGYIGDFELIDDRKGGMFKVSLLGTLNNCGVIRPRFSVSAKGFGKWERRYLPASGFGLLIVSTPKGVMTHTDAIKNNTGGKLLAYVY